MIILCGDSIIIPLRIIFENIISTRIFPDGWKIANVVPVHKKESKHLVKNYKSFSLLAVCAKIFEEVLFEHLYIFTTIFKQTILLLSAQGIQLQIR